MVQISRRALLNYFKMIIENRFYANITYFLKNGVSRTPMWTRDFLTPYYNIQIINRRLQPEKSKLNDIEDYNIQIINRRLQRYFLLIKFLIYYNIQIINRRLQRCRCAWSSISYYNIQIINRRLQLLITFIHV